MANISLEELCPGMELASDLRGSNGRFLLPKGTEIEEKHLRILKIWGVNEVDVVDGDAASCQESESVPPEILQQATELMDRLFSRSNPDFAPVAELRELSIHNTARRLQAGSPPAELAPPAAEGKATLQTAAAAMPSCAKDLADKEVQLASFPDIYFQIRDVLNDPSSTASHVADVVSKDSSLSVKLLRLVNSPFYGFPSRVDSITRAVTLVGSNELSMLALGVSVVQYFDNVPPELLDMRNFWMHSIACGVFARILASHKVGLSEERFFLGGLIHDIGRLVILKNAPECAAAALQLSLTRQDLLNEAEKEVMGFDHAAVAGRLMRLWQFPKALEEMVAWHHDPLNANNVLDATLIHCADIFARSVWTGCKGTFYVPAMEPEAWEQLGISHNIIPTAFTQAEHLISDIYNTFLSAS